MTSLPTTTSAWRMHTRASPATHLQLDHSVPLPALRPGQALIAVEAASINPVDWKMTLLLPGIMQNLPRTLGTDFVGRVVALEPSASTSSTDDFVPTVGQRVYGIFHVLSLRNGQGSLSQYAVCPIDTLAPLPANSISIEHAAGLGIAALTAVRLANIAKKGDRILLLGGSTAVGLLTADMLKSPLVGVDHIVATASGSKIDVLKKRGKIDHYIDYREELNVEATLEKHYANEKFDAVLDCVGSTRTMQRCDAFLKPGGQYFSIGASSIDPKNLLFSLWEGFVDALRGTILPVSLGGLSGKVQKGLLLARRQDWDTLNRYIEGGHLNCVTDSRFSFKEAPKAYERLMTGRALGKVVITIKDEID